MTLEDLKKEYDKLQLKYGAKELDSIYNGGNSQHPDLCLKKYQSHLCEKSHLLK